MHDQKVVRYLGVAAHYQPEPIIDLLNRYPFDALFFRSETRPREVPPTYDE